MSLLMINLERPDYLSDVLLALTQVGVANPTILEGEPGAREIGRQVPLFVGLADGFGRGAEYCRVIIAPVESAAVADDFMKALEDGGIDWKSDALGWLVVIPTDRLVRPD
jgi:hypothetical protein